MASKLSKIQKEALLIALELHLNHGMQQGHGFMDIVKSLYNSPVVRDIVSKVGPIVFEKFIMPYIEKKMGGGGLQLPFFQGLKLAGKSRQKGGGAVKKPHQVKGSIEAKAHMVKLRAMRKK